MILQSLVRYYEALEKKGKITKPGWCMAKVSFALDISEKGELCGLIPLKIEKEQGKKKVQIPQTLMVPQMVTRSSGVASNFLCDNSSYFLGADNKGKPKRSMECFQCAKEKHQIILKNADSRISKAIQNFFEVWEPEKAQEHPIIQKYKDELFAGGNLIFCVDGEFAQDDPQIKEAWETYVQELEEGPEGICLVTGKRAEIARIHGTIKGIQGAQSSGAALVSFNEPAFNSYGKEQSFNAPVSTYGVYAYTTALNHLIADKKHTTVLGDSTIVYWAEDGDEQYQDIFSFISDPTEENQEIVDGVFKSLAQGRPINVDDVYNGLSLEQKFYILGLAPNAARIAVRFFYQDSFGNILKNVRDHYDRLRLVKPVQDTVEYYGIWRLLQATVNKKSKDKKPTSNMAGAVFQSVISGTRYPESLYQSVFIRIRAEQDDSDEKIYKITRGRVAIIKAFLIKNRNYSKEEVTMALNEESKNIAYVLGREFAVLEIIQKEVNPDIKATIKERYFNAACATPASIFPVLFKLKNSHIKKLDNVKKERYYENLLGSLQDKLEVMGDQRTACPRRLSLEEQGMFVLGYYHQRQKQFEKKQKEDGKDERSN